MCMRVTIIGASRTIGSVVVRGLCVEDAYGLACLARRRSEGPDSRGVDQRSVDFSTVACHDTLVGASTGAGAVVHSARDFQLPHDRHATACLTELGIGGIRRVLRAVTETGVPHLIHKSPVGASSPKKDNRGVEESWPTKAMPSSWHSRHKPAAERTLDQHTVSGTGALVTHPWPGIAGQGGAGLLPALVCSVRPRTQQDARTVEGPRADHRDGSPRRCRRGAPPARGGSLPAHRRYARERGRHRGRARSQAGARALCGGPRHAGYLACAPAAARHRVAGHGLRDGPDAPAGVAGGMREAAFGGAPVLQPRTGLGDATHRGPVAVRRLP